MKKLRKLLPLILTLALLLTVFVACDETSETPVTETPVDTDVKYTINFVSNGGTMVPAISEKSGTLVAAPTSPTRSGYTFEGWYSDASFAVSSKIAFPYTVVGNVTFYAMWESATLDITIVNTYVTRTYGETVASYYTATVEDIVTSYDFAGFLEPAMQNECIFGIYNNSSLSDSSLIYVSDQSKWSLYKSTSSVSGLQTSSVMSLNKGNNYFYLEFLGVGEDNNGTQRFDINIRRGNSYTVTFRGAATEYYNVVVPFYGVAFNALDPNNAYYGGSQTTLDGDDSGTLYWDGKLYQENIPTNVVPSGHSFGYWYYYSGTDRYTFDTGEEGVSISSDMTIYGEFQPNEYTVRLSSVGCDVAPDVGEYTVVYNNGDYTFSVPQKREASFRGWYYNNTQITDSVGKLKSAWSIASNNILLIARWDMNTYNLSVTNTDPDAGSVTCVAAGEEIDTDGTLQAVAYSSPLTWSFSANDGYRFVGWTLGEFDDEGVINPASFMPNGPVTYFAQWEKIEYDFALDAGDGVVLNDVGVSQGTTTHAVLDITSAPASLTASKAGHDFLYWYYTNGTSIIEVSDETGGFDVNSWREAYASISADAAPTSISLKAAYQIKKYSFTIEANYPNDDSIMIKFGTGDAITIAAYEALVAEYMAENDGARPTYDYDTAIEVTANITAGDAGAIDFLGWFDDDDNPIAVGVGGTPLTTYTFSLTANTTIQAKYQASEYTVTAVSDDAAIAAIPTENTAIVYYGMAVGEFTLPVPVMHNGYEFTGYYYGTGANKVMITDAEGVSIVKYNFKNDGGITVTAGYVAKTSTVTVTQNLAEAGTVTAPETVAYDGTVELLATFNRGYTFLGWYAVVDGQLSAAPVATSLYYRLNAELDGEGEFVSSYVFQAVWSANRYAVTINYHDATKNDGNASSTYYAVYNKPYLLKNIDSDEAQISERVTTLPADSRHLYEFMGWQYTVNEVTELLTEVDGVIGNNWLITSAVNVSAAWQSIFTMEGGIITGITAYGKEMYDTIVIDDVIDGNTVTGIAEGAFKDWTALKEIGISKEITSIGAGAFEGCTGLEKLTIYGDDAIGASKLVEIGDGAFKNCTALTEIVLPRGIPAAGYGRGILSGCTGITSITYNGRVVLGYLFGTAHIGGDAVELTVQNRVAYYIPTDLATVTFSSGISEIAPFTLANCSNVSNVNLDGLVNTIGANAFAYSGITAIDLQGINTLGSNALRGTGITTLTVPATLTTIGSGAFADCKNLTEVEFMNTDMTKIGESWFEGCSTLEDVTLKSFAVTEIEANAFSGCAAFGGFTGGDPANVLYVRDNAFNGAQANEIRNALTGVREIGYEAFGDEVGLIGKVYYKFSIHNVANGVLIMPDEALYVAEGACKGATGFTSVNLNNVTTVGVSAFENSDVQTVDFGAVEFISPNAFRGSNLTTLDLGASILQIGQRAFADTTALLTVSGGASILVIDNYAFEKSSLTSFAIPAGIQRLGNGVFKNSNIATVTFNGLTGIPDSTFEDCAMLTSIIIPSSVVSIGNYAFSDSALATLTVNCFDEADNTSTTTFNRLTTIGQYAFENSGLSTIQYSTRTTAYEPAEGADTEATEDDKSEVPAQYGFFDGFPTTTATIGEGAFASTQLMSFAAPGVRVVASRLLYNCPNLTTVTFSNTVTSYGAYALAECRRLSTIIGVSGSTTVTNQFATGLTSIGEGAFYNCERLIDQGISSTATTALTTIGEKAFMNNKLIVKVDVPANVTAIGADAFNGCIGLSQLTFAATARVTSIGARAFKGCRTLSEVALANSIVYIEEDAFSGCTGLTSVTVGTGTRAIDARAFYGCSALTGVTFTGTVAPTLGVDAFGDGVTIRVIDMYRADFLATTGWAAYATQVVSYVG